MPLPGVLDETCHVRLSQELIENSIGYTFLFDVVFKIFMKLNKMQTIIPEIAEMRDCLITNENIE